MLSGGLALDAAQAAAAAAAHPSQPRPALRLPHHLHLRRHLLLLHPHQGSRRRRRLYRPRRPRLLHLHNMATQTQIPTSSLQRVQYHVLKTIHVLARKFQGVMIIK